MKVYMDDAEQQHRQLSPHRKTVRRRLVKFVTLLVLSSVYLDSSNTAYEWWLYQSVHSSHTYTHTRYLVCHDCERCSTVHLARMQQ